MVTICATCFVSEHCTLPTERIYVSSGQSIPALAPWGSTLPMDIHCQVSNNCARHQQATDRQTVQCCVYKHNQELALVLSVQNVRHHVAQCI